MSVINKMLRDLDSRQGGAAALPAAPTLSPELLRGTATSVPRDRVRAPVLPRIGFAKCLWVALALGIGAGAWWYLSVASPAPSVSLPLKILAPTVNQVPVVAASEQPPQTASKAETASGGTFSLKMDTQARLAPHLTRPVGTLAKVSAETPGAIKPVPSVAPPSAAPSLAPTSEPPQSKVPVLVSASSVVSAPLPTPVTLNPVAQRQAAATEALSQAQTLWTAGSREAAIDLMREAVAVAERGAGATPGASPVLISLVRELARMELAEGQAARVVDMLTRLEPALAGQADLWAVRGNAAQRLGRHQESANAYLRALRLRPDEPRWMLGAAVSLAAQGQPLAAADLAERARTGGAVTREVAAYLRQLGVPLREQ